MPDIDTTLGDLLKDYVKPIADSVGLGGSLGPYAALVAALDSAGVLDRKIEIPIPSNLIPSPDAGNGDGGGETGWPGSGLPNIPPLAPIDPQEAMKAVARAMREAEKILNAENLAIGGAGVDISFIVQVAGVAGANANLKITIGPTPRA